MVVGGGLVARGFQEYKSNGQVVIFASGVSNSSTTASQEFDREKTLLLDTIDAHPGKTLIYFSTCAVYDPTAQESLYVQHKKKMEDLIFKSATQFLIFRISNLAGRTKNPYTVLNYFANHIRSGEFFFLWTKASRNIIDLDDALPIIRYMINHNLFSNEIVNIANPSNYPVATIIECLERVIGKKGNFERIDKGSAPVIDTARMVSISRLIPIHFGPTYLDQTICKYYA